MQNDLSYRPVRRARPPRRLLLRTKWRPTQRDLVVASLMVCDREDPPVHRRWA